MKLDAKKYELPPAKAEFTSEMFSRLVNYTLEQYVFDVENLGLSTTWENICEFSKQNYGSNDLLKIDKFGKLYEIGLAIQDKHQKKDCGQYYTPQDVANVMSAWLAECDGYNLCDVACGTGKLILTYLDLIGREKAKKLITDGRLHLYDLDSTALRICTTSIALKYGLELQDKINNVRCDFLDEQVRLPDNCKVISNPPYASVSKFGEKWKMTEVLKKTKDVYSAFMEKIFLQAESAAIITPFSFVSCNKYYPLRKLMCDIGYGFIVTFDNIPGNIFCGKKRGIFNTNKLNSVRAAITVLKKDKEQRGFRTTHLIRFKNSERKKVLVNSYLESLLSDEYQTVKKSNPTFKKIDARLNGIYDSWIQNSNATFGSLTSKKGGFFIAMPKTCRYFTTASNARMNRTRQIELRFDDEDKFNYAFCLINSSFAYWYWRIFDGGVTYPKKLLLKMPVFFDRLTCEDKSFFKSTAKEMISIIPDCAATKINVGVQENIKYPKEYRDKINQRILRILKVKSNPDAFDRIHSNMATEIV